MSDFSVGDKVYISVFEDENMIGEIISEGDIPWSDEQDMLSREKSKTIYWWKVTIDATGEIKDFPEDRLKRIRTPKTGDNVHIINGKDKGKTGEIVGSVPIGLVTYWAIEFEGEEQAILEENTFEILTPE